MTNHATLGGRFVLLATVATTSVGLALGCGNGDGRPQSAAGGGTGLSNSGSGGSADAASGGIGASAGGGGAAGSAETGGVGTFDAGAGSGGNDGGVPPIDTACDRSMAFWATGASFVFPTPKGLASALGPLTYDYTEHPVTVVLAMKGGSASVAASATEAPVGSQPPGFLAGKKPVFVPASIAIGGFASTASQAQGWLRIKDQTGFKDIELNNIDLSVVTSNQCSTMLAQLTAVIPSSQGGLALDLPSGSTTLGALAGGSSSGGQTPDGGSIGWNLRLVFTGESTDFDFASL